MVEATSFNINLKFVLASKFLWVTMIRSRAIKQELIVTSGVSDFIDEALETRFDFINKCQVSKFFGPNRPGVSAKIVTKSFNESALNFTFRVRNHLRIY